MLVGPTFLDIDLQRAHKALGIIPRDQAAFNEQMKTIAPGHFWALGRAISKQRVLVKIGDIQTTHPTAGSGKYSAEPPPAPDKVKALLPKLADLPQEAESKARSEAEFRREIRELKHQLSTANRAKPVASPPAAASDSRAIERAVSKAVYGRDQEWHKQVRTLTRQIEQMRKAAKQTIENFATAAAPLNTIANLPPPEMPNAPEPAPVSHAAIVLRAPAPRVNGSAASHTSHAEASDSLPQDLGALALKVAGILAGYYPEALKRNVVATLCGVVDGGNFSNRLSELRTNGLLEDPGRGLIKASALCAERYAGSFQPPSNTEEVVRLWEPKLGELARKILRELVTAQGEAVPRGDLAAAVGVADGGNFSNRLSELRTAGLLVDPQRGHVAGNKETLFLDGMAA